MKIGIIGTGEVARALAAGYAKHSHEVRIGSRSPDRPELTQWSPGSASEVTQWADLVVLAVTGDAAEAVAGQIAQAAAGKVLIDTTNWVDRSHGDLRLGVPYGDSLGERVQRAAPQARVVKAYNSVGNAFMVDPDFPDGAPTMFIAGNDASAKAEVGSLLESTGWEVADYGPIEAGRLFDGLVLTWVGYGMATGTWNHAFKLIRK